MELFRRLWRLCLGNGAGTPVSVFEAGIFAFLFRCRSRILHPRCCCGADRLALSFEGLAPILVGERPTFFLISDF